MAAFTAGDLHLDLRNPEYMPRPEILISELAALNYSVVHDEKGLLGDLDYHVGGMFTP